MFLSLRLTLAPHMHTIWCSCTTIMGRVKCSMYRGGGFFTLIAALRGYTRVRGKPEAGTILFSAKRMTSNFAPCCRVREKSVCLYCFVRVTLHLPQCGLWTKRRGTHMMYTWDVLSHTHVLSTFTFAFEGKTKRPENCLNRLHTWYARSKTW